MLTKYPLHNYARLAMDGVFTSADYVLMVLYALVRVSMDFYLRKRASVSIEDYFIRGRKIP